MTEHEVLRTVARWQQVDSLNALLAQVHHWQVAGWTSQRIADELNALGHRTPHGLVFTADSVRQLLSRTSKNGHSTDKKGKSRKKR